MELHIAGGFLGSGKTTAIAAAAESLIAADKRVGIVTNDQGKYLVDTAFFRALKLPAVEVTGGCFCCNYDDLDARLAELEATAHPDIIFAESVGSCADIVATVIKPLMQLSVRPASLSVFADSRLLLQRLRGLPLPFSDDVVYVFDAQIEEAGLLVVNKTDLLLPADLAELQALVAARWPDKRACFQNARAENGVTGWLALLQRTAPQPDRPPLEIDYARYGAGEGDLAWMDMTVTVRLPDHDGRTFVHALATAVDAALQRDGIAVGHLKLATVNAPEQVKISLTSVRDSAWAESLPPLKTDFLSLIVNLRAQAPAETLERLARAALEKACAAQGASVTDSALDAFHPGFPNPTHRLA
ncbi:MAG TPA: GTP-binding protein [Candidatus Limnocylindrales bacterium]|nr:GTP-binding protein [Candidatus Limnocylindrales bacterium]